MRRKNNAYYRLFILCILLSSVIAGFVWFKNDTKQLPQHRPDTGNVQAQDSATSRPPGTPIALPADLPLKEKVTTLESTTPGTFGIAVKNLTTGETFFQNENEPFLMASTYKVPLVLTSYVEEEKGNLDPNADLGAGFTVATGREPIITRSEEDLAENLAAILGWPKIQQFTNSLGMQNTYFDNHFTTTPKDMMVLLEKIYNGQGMSKSARDNIYTLMAKQQIADRIAKYLPASVTVADKTGDLDDVRHDIGIVTAGKQVYVIVLMAKGLSTPQDGIETEAQLSNTFYQYFIK